MRSATKSGKKWNEINYVEQTKIEKWDKLSGTEGVYYKALFDKGRWIQDKRII